MQFFRSQARLALVVSACIAGAAQANAIPPELEELLSGKNYIIQWEGESIADVTVSGNSGSGEHSGQTDNTLTATYLPLDPAQVPAEYRSLPPGSLSRIQLPMGFMGMKLGGKFVIDLPSGRYEFTKDNEYPHPGGMTWVGKLSEDDSFRMMVTSGENGTMTGSIKTPDGEFLLEAYEGETWMLDASRAGLQQPAFPPDAVSVGGGFMADATGEGSADQTDPPPAMPLSGVSQDGNHAGSGARPSYAGAVATTGSAGSTTTTVTATAATNTVDVLVLYTQNFASKVGATTRINYLFAVANQAYKDSGVPVRLRPVFTQKTSFPETGLNEQALQNMTFGWAAFTGSNIKTLRDKYGADLVTLLRPFRYAQQASCGTSWITQFGTPSTYGYSVVSDGTDGLYYCHDLSFVHEIGHNLGQTHERANAGGGMGYHAYSYGWGVDGLFGTVMSYINPKVGKFAGPKLTCPGNRPCGYPEWDRYRASDQVKSLSLVAPIVAKFKPTLVK